MKNKLLSIWLGISLFILVFQSCKQHEEELSLFVPKDATGVIVIDTKAITDKISSSGITIDSLANLFNKTGGHVNWSDIKNSGIDLQKPCIFFTKETNSVQSGKSTSTGFVAAVEDKNKLENFLKKQVADAGVKADKNYQYINIGSGYVAGWNDKVLIIYGTVNGEENNPDDLFSQQQLTALFARSESNSIASINEFNDMLKKQGDIHFWSNASGQLNALPMMGMTKIGDLLKDTYTDGTIDFENGKMVATSESHINSTLSDIINKYPSKEIDKGMITNYPGNINGFGIISFNPKVLLDILHYLGFDIMINNYSAELGFDMNDVVNAFSGDIAFVMSNLFMKDNDVPDMGNMPNKEGYILNMRIGDKAAFDKVMTGLTNKNFLSKNGDQYQLGKAGGHEFVIETTGDALLIGSSDDLLKSYDAGKSKNSLPVDIEKEINNKSSAIYIDVASMLNNINTTDTSDIKVLNQAKATFKNLVATSDKGDGKTITGNFELNFINQNENSLASLAKFMAVAHDKKAKYTRLSPPI
jgi:hypothetical protein